MVLHARRPEISFLDPWSRTLHARPRLAMILRLLLNLYLFYHTVRRFNHSKNALYFYITQNPETARNLLPLSLTVLAVFLLDQLGARKYSHAFTDQNDKHVITILSTWKWKDNITGRAVLLCCGRWDDWQLPSRSSYSLAFFVSLFRVSKQSSVQDQVKTKVWSGKQISLPWIWSESVNTDCVEIETAPFYCSLPTWI